MSSSVQQVPQHGGAEELNAHSGQEGSRRLIGDCCETSRYLGSRICGPAQKDLKHTVG